MEQKVLFVLKNCFVKLSVKKNESIDDYEFNNLDTEKRLYVKFKQRFLYVKGEIVLKTSDCNYNLLLGIKNVKTLCNRFIGKVMFTFPLRCLLDTLKVYHVSVVTKPLKHRFIQCCLCTRI